MFTFNHFNFNVADLDKSIQFYHDALGLESVRRKEALCPDVFRRRENGFPSGVDMAPGPSAEV